MRERERGDGQMWIGVTIPEGLVSAVRFDSVSPFGETGNRRQLQLEAWTTPPSLSCATRRMWTRTNCRSLLGILEVACVA